MFNLKVVSNNLKLSVDTKRVHMAMPPIKVIIDDEAPKYEGDYEVTPDKNNQVLYTQDKKMTDDLTVLAVPYHTVSNMFNGTTVIIGQ